MKGTRFTLVALMVLLVSACSSETLAPPDNPSFSVSSSSTGVYVVAHSDGELDDGTPVFYDEIKGDALVTCTLRFSVDPGSWQAIEGYLVRQQARYEDGGWVRLDKKTRVFGRALAAHLFGSGHTMTAELEFFVILEVALKNTATGKVIWRRAEVLCGQ